MDFILTTERELKNSGKEVPSQNAGKHVLYVQYINGLRLYAVVFMAMIFVLRIKDNNDMKGIRNVNS